MRKITFFAIQAKMEPDFVLAPFRICTYLAMVLNCTPKVVLPIYISCPPLTMRDMFSHFKFELVQRLKADQQNPENERLYIDVITRSIKTASSFNFLSQPHQNNVCTEKSKEWKLFINGRPFIEFTGLGTLVLSVAIMPPRSPEAHFDFGPLRYKPLLWIAHRYSAIPGQSITVDATAAFDELLQNTYL